MFQAIYVQLKLYYKLQICKYQNSLMPLESIYIKKDRTNDRPLEYCRYQNLQRGYDYTYCLHSSF